jgi:hypothetical protein
MAFGRGSEVAGRVRFAMGMAQMFGAVAGLVLLIATGPSAATLVVVALTTALALTSRALARGRRLPRKPIA